MKAYLPILLFLFYSCNSLKSIRRTDNYRTAIANLSYIDYKEKFDLIPKKELEKRNYLNYLNDTIYLKANKKTFGIRNKESKDIFVFNFYWDKTFKRFKCDSLWTVVLATYSMGEAYRLSHQK